MRRALPLVVASLTCLALASPAWGVPSKPSSPVGIIAEQRAVGSLLWDLYLFTQPGIEVGSINLLTAGFESFEFASGVPNLSYFDSAYSLDPLGDGRNALLINNTVPGALGGGDDLDGLLLGTFASTLPTLDSVLLMRTEEIGVSPVYDRFGNVPPDYWLGPLGIYPPPEVPEPFWPLSLGPVAILAARRLRPAQHRSR